MIDPAMRNRTAAMMRIRNEARWIRSSLERTFEVARTVVLWDDGSTDATLSEAIGAMTDRCGMALGSPVVVDMGDRQLHIVRSPFRYRAVRPREVVNEIRDKNCLWYYCKASVDFDYMLCLDGDEVLTLEAIRNWPEAIAYLHNGTADIMTVPFVYLWDAMDMRRVDGLYGDLADGMPQLRFPRLFTILRLSQDDLFDSHFSWQGTKGGFHCGSIPREKYRRADGSVVGGQARLPIAHYGYVDDALRQSKVAFYRSVDPDNAFEGNYNHCLGEPDQHAPGPVQCVPWVDV